MKLNLKIAWRNLIKNKVYSLINIVGLATGIACCVMILLWIQDELGFDRFHENEKYIYRQVNHEEYSNGESVDFEHTPFALAPVLKKDFPEIRDVTRVRLIRDIIVRSGDIQYNETGFFFVEPNFFEIFTFPLKIGNKSNVLSNPNSIVLTEEMATRYFGDQNPVGQTIVVNNEFHFFVTGIAKNPPANTQLNFNFLVPIDNVKSYYRDFREWNTWAFTNFILLNENADYKLLNEKIKNVIKENQDDAIATVSLQPLSRVHLHSRNIWGIGGKGDIIYVRIFAVIAFFVLLTACINFMNLSTARSGLRAKEVGLRKAIGSRKRALILQFFGESFLMVILAMLIAVLIVFVTLPFFNDISGKQIHFNLFREFNIMAVLLATTLIASVLAGSYPALFLSSFQPVKVLKGINTNLKGSLFRRVLVVVQFSLTIILIVGSIVVNRQLHYMRSCNMGFDTEYIVSIRLKGALKDKTELLKSELSKNNGVTGISASSNLPINVATSYIVNSWDERVEENQFLAHHLSVDYDFLNIFHLEMADGRFFSPEFATDSSALIVNESAIENMGWTNFEGKTCMGGNVIGVLKDFNFKSLHDKSGPLTMSVDKNNFSYLFVKIKSSDMQETMKRLEEDWGKVASAYPFDFKFIDDNIEQMYHSDQRIEKVINAFTILLLFIASLGMFGLSSFSAEQKIKENGIRKILGSSVSEIVFKLSGDFLKWVAIANIIAWPVAYFFMHRWLENFAYKTTLSWWIFALAGVLALGIALLTVSWQSWRAATRNPVEALRYE